eukprot:3374353-Prymnesium_polylepis.1
MAPSRSMVCRPSLGVVTGGKREFCAHCVAVLSSVEHVKHPAPPVYVRIALATALAPSQLRASSEIAPS